MPIVLLWLGAAVAANSQGFCPMVSSYFLTVPIVVFISTLTLQKSRMLQVQGVKGEAVVSYAESLTTQEMRCPRLSRRVNNTANTK
ncbi:MAG: hypothetical protein JRJ75_17735 [Deltaproteobacteria bacterium]|nr:hypothetical protein [Deltaproteobacteria bacterium]MBW1796546.1 hypothetical protein [Deltaproteobacteria bacterium]